MSLLDECNIKVKQRTATRLSKIELLPDDIKEHLDEMLYSRRYEQASILNEVNTLIKLRGLDKARLLSRSALNRYAVDLRRKARKDRSTPGQASQLVRIERKLDELIELLKAVTAK